MSTTDFKKNVFVGLILLIRNTMVQEVFISNIWVKPELATHTENGSNCVSQVIKMNFCHGNLQKKKFWMGKSLTNDICNGKSYVTETHELRGRYVLNTGSFPEAEKPSPIVSIWRAQQQKQQHSVRK